MIDIDTDIALDDDECCRRERVDMQETGPKSGCHYVEVILHCLYIAGFTYTLSCIYQHPQCLYVGVALASALVEHIVNNGHE